MLVNLPLNSPGKLGLNKQESASTLDLDWAIKAENIVFDQQGKLSARKGTVRTNTDTITDPVEQIFEYIDNGGNSLIICSGGGDIFKRDNLLLTSIKGLLTPTENKWKFINFNGKCLGAQAGHSLIYLSDVGGDFSAVSLSGTQQPSTGTNEILACIGRVWALDGQDLKYSDLLDETSWDGVYDLHTYWGSGDVGVALAEFNGNIIVFGKNNIIIYDYSQGADGLVKVEVLNGIGCIARDSVEPVGDDIWFLSSSGVRSLSRTIQEKSMPLTDISKNVRDYLISSTPSDKTVISADYNEKEGLYLLSFPTTNVVFCFDTKGSLPDGSVRVTTFKVSWQCVFSSIDKTLYIGTTGYLNTYSGYFDDVAAGGSSGTTYTFCYYSPWTSLAFLDQSLSGKYKILKSMSCTVFAAAAQAIQFHWFTDFMGTLYKKDISINPSKVSSQYGINLYGVGQYSSSVNLTKAHTPMGRTAQYFSFGIFADIGGDSFSLQFINIQARIGRSVL
jgi:hypothetical protein